MAKNTVASLAQIGSAALRGKGIGTPQIQVGKAALGSAQVVSNDLFGYDFVSLGIKLFVFFAVAFIFAKFMEAVIFTRGLFLTFVGLLGFNLPNATEFPQSLRDLFGDGLHGFKFWDIVKIVAVLLVIAELIRYTNANRNAGSQSSPLTIGVFVLIIGILAVTTIPELFSRLKATNFNLEEFK